VTTQKTNVKYNKSKKSKSAAKIPQKSQKKGWLFLGIGLAGVAMLSATAGAMLALSLSSKPLQQHKLSAQEASVFSGDRISSSSLRLPELTRPVNILVMGVSVLASDLPDAPDHTKNLSYQPQMDSVQGLSDTMLLIRFNPENQKLSVLSIPRDTKVEIENHGTQKINAANILGGPALSAKVTSELLGNVAIDRYVRINVMGVGKLVDTLGGLNVYVPKDMKYTDNTQHLYVDLKQGQHHLNGDQVMQLLRFRYDRLGDIGRIQRQQMVMRALMEQFVNASILGSLPQLLSLVQSHIDTNLNVEELMALVNFAAQMDRAHLQMLVLPGDYNGDGHKQVSYWLPSGKGISKIMSQHFDLENSADETTNISSNSTRTRIAIQDSTGNKQAVQKMIQALSVAGYRNVYIAERWNEPLKVTRVIAESGDKNKAQNVQQSIGLGDLRVETTGNLGSDVTIQIGEDWLQKQPISP
jgi:polyisoprenyl-teichoic acid--peptidoglycan teichoic acid transferase